MPRLITTDQVPFGFSSTVPPQEAVPPFSSSVRLSCSSPGGRAIHSLSSPSSGAYYIETHKLPLEGTTKNERPNYVERSPYIIRTRLPEKICSALSRYPAIELLCVDVANAVANTKRTNKNENNCTQLPLLCLYTEKDVFILDITYEATIAAEVEGVVSNILEPYEEFLIGNAVTNIVRIRQAPQKFNGYATLCPVGAMSMLTQNPSTSEYCLCIYHGIFERSPSSITSKTRMGLTSHYFRMEYLSDPSERISDFCFCQSRELPLLSSLTVAFLKVSGEVHFATPIVFHGTVVPSQTVTESMDFLDSSLKESDTHTATWRQFRTAKQFLIDAFPNNGRTNFVTVGQITTARSSSRPEPPLQVFNWQLQIQGPILLPPHPEELSYVDNNNDLQMMMSAESIEPFATEGDLAGLSIGHLAKMVDFAVVSPSSFVPRFEFESPNDTDELNQNLMIGHIVNRVNLDGSNITVEDSVVKGIKLIPDPMMGNVIHYMTPNQIIGISTNATKIASNEVREHDFTNLIGRGGKTHIGSPPSRSSDLRPKTTVWKCFDASFFEGRQNSIVGAMISDDVQLGHTLVVQISNGEVIAINLTETRHLRELENFSAPERFLAIQNSSSVAISEAENQTLAVLDQTEALSKIVQPLMQDVIKGIGMLAQVGGTATAKVDVSPDVLSGFIGIQSKCKKEIFLPLMTMNEHVTARKAEFKAENARRKQQLQALKEIISRMREKQNLIEEKTNIMIQNSKSLADRSTSVLQSSTDIFPTITQAEYDFFQELKRLDEKTKIWENHVEVLSRKVSNLNDSVISTNPYQLNLSPQYLKNAGHLLDASGHLLNKYERSFASAKDSMDGLASSAGFARDANH